VQGTGGVPATVNEILAEVKHRYDYKDAEHAESTLRSMAQTAKESTTDFVIRATAVARKAIRRKRDERRMVRVIIDGCQQPTKAWLLLQNPPPRTFRDLETSTRNHDLAHGKDHGSGGIPVHAVQVVGASTTTAKSKKREKSKDHPVQRYIDQLPDAIQAAAVQAVPPPTPCPHCRQMHWARNCPVRPGKMATTATPTTSAATQSSSTAAASQPFNQRTRPPYNPEAVCTTCARVGHFAHECWVPLCSACHRHGHITQRCPMAATAATTTTAKAPAQLAQGPARVQQYSVNANATTVKPSPQDDETAASHFQ
jgi:hypothetical protein